MTLGEFIGQLKACGVLVESYEIEFLEDDHDQRKAAYLQLKHWVGEFHVASRVRIQDDKDWIIPQSIISRVRTELVISDEDWEEGKDSWARPLKPFE